MRLIVFAAILMVALVQVAVGAVDRSSDVVHRLQQCPSWESDAIKDSAARASITETYIEISQLDSKSVRKGVVLYLTACSNDLFKEEEAWGKLYGLFRVFFKIGEGYHLAASPFDPETRGQKYWSFWGSPWKDGKVDLLWPYTIDKSGQLLLMKVHSVQDRTGPGYSPLSDFDSLMASFGRRFISDEKNR